MNKQKAMHIIRTMPDAGLIEFLLKRCNLSDREQHLINARIKGGMTQERYAESIDRSTRHVQEVEEKAFKKIIENWSPLDFLAYF